MIHLRTDDAVGASVSNSLKRLTRLILVALGTKYIGMSGCH
jgi:hypothetical protein